MDPRTAKMCKLSNLIFFILSILTNNFSAFELFHTF